MRKLLITCEHGGNDIPHAFATLFSVPQAILESHRGIDIGALDLAKFLAQHLSADAYFENTITRLLIDFNRSKHNGDLFSEFSRPLSEEIRQTLMQDYYLPYWHKIEQTIAAWIAEGHEVVHLAVHSFTPELNGKVRRADFGLLYDSKRECEKQIARQWLHQIRKHITPWARCNYPYLGKSDGLPTALRKKFREHYAGIELETNQALWQEKAALVEQTQHRLAHALTL